MSSSGERVPEVGAKVVVERHDVVESTPAVSRVLVTNDDGIDAPGIACIARTLAKEFDVTVAAPDRDRSGAGTGIGHFDPRAGIPLRRADIDGVRAYAIDGPPGLAVMAAALGAFGPKFDVVVSGINSGVNTGQSVIHSGTVGAALTARTFGWHGVAVSLEPSDPWQWDTAAAIGCSVVRWVCSQTREPVALNVNAPGVPLDQVRGLRQAQLGRSGYFRVAIADEGGQKLEFEVASDAERPVDEGSDTALIRDRWATITSLSPLTGIPLVETIDVTTLWSAGRG